MRVSAKNTPATVTAAPGTAHPIRLRTSIAVFQLDLDEAVSLATELINAVEQLRRRTP